jgi:hypothetical protein
VRDAEIAALTGLARTTVRDIRAPRPGTRPRLLCPRCWEPCREIVWTAADYAELLGLYLGDGCIARAGRTFRLRIALDAKYPGILAETEALLRRCFPGNRVSCARLDGGATAVPSVYSRHLPCLFPQHGAGKKHHREISLERWQRDLVAAAPFSFLRGCIWSDGCAYVNRTGPYEYLSYDFHNESPGIIEAFATACDLAGVEYRRYRANIRVYRRASVAILEREVGAKR